VRQWTKRRTEETSGQLISVRVLEYFTDGNATRADAVQIPSRSRSSKWKGLEKLLDEVTLLQAKVEIYHRSKEDSRPSLEPAAKPTRANAYPNRRGDPMPVNQVSAQLKRLSDSGYVNGERPGRSSFYTLSEPLRCLEPNALRPPSDAAHAMANRFLERMV
jgi:hypothetical protein